MNRDKEFLNYLGNMVGVITFFLGIYEVINVGWNSTDRVWNNYDGLYLILGGTICLLVTEIMKRSR